MADTVCVLMSVYNGEKYLNEQIDSILLQEKIKVCLIIRDDGSTDSSRDILHTYGDRIELIEGENIGVQKSFTELVKYAVTKKYKYYAFSDQDDVWKSNKLEVAITKLKQIDKIPAVYCCNLAIVDCNLQYQGKVFYGNVKINKMSSCVRNYAYGCTQVFNISAAELYCEGEKARMWMHDYWLYLIGIYLGKIIYDSDTYILYRQHGKNAVGINHSIIKVIKNKLRSLKRLNRHPRWDMLYDFKNCYLDKIDNEGQVVLDDFLGYRYTLKKRVRAMTNTGYFVFNIVDNMILKIRFLIGAV